MEQEQLTSFQLYPIEDRGIENGSLERAEAALERSERDIQLLVTEALSQGEHLKENPFMPEELGFVRNVDEGDTFGLPIEVYSLEDNHIAMHPEGHWVLKLPEMTESIKLEIVSEYDALIAFRALGLPISLEEVLGASEESEETIEKINKGLLLEAAEDKEYLENKEEE